MYIVDPTGGGCVYADHRNTMFSIITKRANKEFTFKTYLSKIIDSMKNLDVKLSLVDEMIYCLKVRKYQEMPFYKTNMVC
jgi:lipoate-protein ligase A